MSETTTKITIETWHELLYIFGYIRYKGVKISGWPEHSDKHEEWSLKINKALDKFHQSESEKISKFIERMYFDFSKDKLNLSDIDFIKNNEITCMFAWLYIRQCHVDERKTINRIIETPLYRHVHFPVESQNHCERYQIICDYFDYGYLTKSNKNYIIDSLWSTCEKIKDNIKPMHWLDRKDDKQCEWACDYIMQRYKPECIKIIKPDETSELYLLVLGLFYLMVATVGYAEWKLFLNDINRAWSQRKHRINKKEQSPLNTYLDKKTKEKLKALCIKEGMSIQNMLSHLIVNAHDKIK